MNNYILTNNCTCQEGYSLIINLSSITLLMLHVLETCSGCCITYCCDCYDYTCVYNLSGWVDVISQHPALSLISI